MDDRALVSGQLGREPRGRWRVTGRCSFGYPVTIATAPQAGEVFPTLYYLTCPHLVEAVSALESAGAIALWRARLAADEGLAARMRSADLEYRKVRCAEGGGIDPTPDVGIAGQRDACATKCLHAHVAAALAGLDDPVGRGVLEGVDAECADERCRRWDSTIGDR